MPAPPGRVFAGSETSRLRPIEHGLNPTTHATGRLRFDRPDRFKDSHHHRDVNISDRDRAELGIDVCCQGIRPLLSMLCIAPSGRVRVDVGPRTLGERHVSGGLDLLCAILRLTALERIDLVDEQQTLRCGLLPRISETDFRQPTEAHLSRLAFKHVAQTPALRAAPPDTQIEPATIRIETCFRRCCDRSRRQSIELVRHESVRPFVGWAEGFRDASALLKLPPNPTKSPAIFCGIKANADG